MSKKLTKVQIRSIYQAFDPAPLEVKDASLYVDLDKQRGDSDVVDKLIGAIQFSSRPTAQVLAGHRGSGKSTELRRLQGRLEAEDPKFLTVLCGGTSDIDTVDVAFPEILIAIVRQVAKVLKDKLDVELKPGYFTDRWKRLKKLFTTEIEFNEIGLEAGFAKLGMTLKGSPDIRLKLREAFEPDAGNWLTAANEVLDQATIAAVKNGYAGLVVIFDELDKMDDAERSVELFVRRQSQLTGFKCHLVYSMPLALAYSHHQNSIRQAFNGDVPVVPMTKVRNLPPDGKPHPPGIEMFAEIIRRRIKPLNLTMNDLFQSEDVRESLILLTGGQPTELMTMTREALVGFGAPITQEAIERVQREGSRDYARQLLREHWEIIAEVRKSGVFVPGKTNETQFRELLAGRALLQYVNAVEWYGLNPLVAAIEPPKNAKSL